MIIKLEYDEIKLALAKALEDKVNSIFGWIDPDDCTFTVTDNTDNEVDINSISFEVNV